MFSMYNYLFPLYAVIIGVCIALITKHKKTLYTKHLLSFSGAFILALTLIELLPEVYMHLEAKLIGMLILGGIVIQIFLESLYLLGAC